MKLPSYCLAVLFCLPFAAQAGMVKCKLPNGSSTYQDTPCTKDADASAAHVSGMQYVGGSEPDQGTGSSSSGGASGSRTTNVYINQTTNVQVNTYNRAPQRAWAERVRLVDTKSAPSNSNTTRASTAAATSSGTSRTSTASHAAAGHR